jgi:dihydrolipoamide dehydrogenase
MGANGKSVLTLQERGFIKAVLDAETGALLGAQLMCARATDMISEFSLAIAQELTGRELGGIIRPHPTFE